MKVGKICLSIGKSIKICHIVVKITISRRDYKPNCHSDFCVCVKFQEKPVEKTMYSIIVFLTTTKDVGMFWRLEIQSADRREM